MFVRLKFLRNAPVNARGIQGINLGIKDDVIEVPDDDGEASEHRLVVMNGRGHHHHPAGQILGHINFQPDGQAGGTHEDGAPDHRPVLHLFRIAKASDLRLDRAPAAQIKHGLPDIRHIFFHGK